MKYRKLWSCILTTACVVSLTACTAAKGNENNDQKDSAPSEAGKKAADSAKKATDVTKKTNEEVYTLLDFDDQQELEAAQKNLIAAPEELEIKDDSGKVVWSQKAYAFLEDTDAPDTVNPSLWRHTQMNHLYGLFQVTDGIYQVRGYDMTNITFIEGDTGWIVFDPLISTECARAALELVNKELGERPVMGIVMSHPHVDHYGGIKGIISAEEVAERKIPIIAPEGFEEHAVSENVYAGTAMGRRAGYQYGTILAPGEPGSMAIGLGMGPSTGTISYLPPNDSIKATGDTRTIDGIEMEIQMTPGTEAPAEMNTWFPQKNALWMAENCTGTLHNLYTLRGAQVRDGNAWAGYIMEALTRYGGKAEVVFQAHNWPHWGNDVITEYMKNTAAVYKFINDQTLMYINQGYTSDEIAGMITLPEKLSKIWYTRQYYGTVAHNSKAVYQRYMGWYDANPVNLNRLAPTDRAKKYMEYMGDADGILKKAKKDFEKGEYQWVAEVTNMIVFDDPDNQEARNLCADALEQLGYQAESGTWRNAYLSGARELREGTINDPAVKATGSFELMQSMSPEMMMDYLGILLDANAAQDLNLKINLDFTDEEPYLLTVESGVVLYQKGAKAPDADATLTMPRLGMFSILGGDKEQQKKAIHIEGDQDVITKLTEHMVEFEFFFNIIEP